MENNKDIGKAIRDKLSDFDQSPDDKLWLKIEADLDKKKKRRILPFWLVFGAALLLSGIGWIYQNSPSGPGHPAGENLPGQRVSNSIDSKKARENEANPSDEKALDEKTLKNDPLDEKAIVERTSVEKTTAEKEQKKISADRNPADLQKTTQKQRIGKTKKGDQSLAENKKTKTNKAKIIAGKSNNTGNDPAIPANNKNENENEIQTGITAKTDNKTVETGILKPGRTPVTPEEKPTDPTQTDSLGTAQKKKSDKKSELPAAIQKIAQKLDIFVYAAPTYAGNFSNASPLDRRLNDNKKTTEIRFGYGAYCIYETDDRWSLRFGLALVNLRYITENATVNTTDYSYIAYSDINNAMIYAQSGDTSMDIIQDVSYLEIPLGFKYVLRPARFGVNLYGGLSYLLLAKNEVSARTSSGMRFDLGQTETLSDNSFTVNAGIGFDYKLGKQIRINLEPVFKLHLFDYKNLNARPYSIGVLAGLQFSLK